jgi:zinc protease
MQTIPLPSSCDQSTDMMRKFFLSIFLGFLFAITHASAFEVQEIVSPKGVSAWLVESHDVPIVSMMFSMPGGRNFEPEGKEGAHTIMADMLVEGAGSLSSEQFKAEKVRMSSRLSFYTSGDFTMGYLSALSKNRDATADLLKQALESPRFEEPSFNRLRDQAMQDVAAGKVDQNTIAEHTWFSSAFPGHIYGRGGTGTENSLKGLTTDDLRNLWKATANRRNLQVAVVGDVTPAELRLLLDRTFGGLPDHSSTIKTPTIDVMRGPIEKRINYDGPQTVVYFGNPALPGETREGWSSNVLAEILGGQASFARLTQALREKSGLTYGVGFGNYDWRYASAQLGMFSTATATAEQALAMLKQQLAEMANTGPTADELRKIKSYINGSYALRFSDNDSIASELLSVMQRGSSVGYFKERPSRVNAVTVEDVKSAAAKLLQPENQIIVVVGKLKG